MEENIYLDDTMFLIIMIITLTVSMYKVSKYIKVKDKPPQFYFWIMLIFAIISSFIIVEFSKKNN